jgi:hypothetical protein
MLSILEASLHSTLDKLSNGEDVEVKDEWIDEACAQLRAALEKQLKTKRDPEFRLRMSNIGRPLCQLQMAAKGEDSGRMDYSFIMKMLFGDSVEILTRLLLKINGANVTSDGDKVKLNVSDVSISGESDIDINNKVYDIKSCSPWAFKNKWSEGFEGMLKDDGFGYVGQLFGYADAQKKAPGGWIVVDKSSGEIAVVEVKANKQQVASIRQKRKDVVEAISQNKPFQRCFEDEPEFWRRKPTGNKKINKKCHFCDYKKACWPKAVYTENVFSTAQSKPFYWYTEITNYQWKKNAD